MLGQGNVGIARRRAWHDMTTPVLVRVQGEVDVPYRERCNLAIHKLIFGCRPLYPLLGQLHRIPRIVNISQDLHWDHRPDVLSHVIYGRQMVYDVVSSQVGERRHSPL